MPLVDPVTMGADGDKNAEWMKKLVGKKIGDTSDAVVRYSLARNSSNFYTICQNVYW